LRFAFCLPVKPIKELVKSSLLAFCGSAVFRITFAYGAGEGFQPIFRDFALPKVLSICGAPMPSDNQAVLDRLDRELTFIACDQAQVFMLIKMPSETYYVVLPGNSLARISNKVGIPVDVLRRINGIQGSHISVGQKLRLNS
jgi:hypothetical protein